MDGVCFVVMVGNFHHIIHVWDWLCCCGVCSSSSAEEGHEMCESPGNSKCKALLCIKNNFCKSFQLYFYWHNITFKIVRFLVRFHVVGAAGCVCGPEEGIWELNWNVTRAHEFQVHFLSLCAVLFWRCGEEVVGKGPSAQLCGTCRVLLWWETGMEVCLFITNNSTSWRLCKIPLHFFAQ